MVFTIADLLNQWASVGVFDYLLPFLLIFAVVLGILTSINFWERKINVIIALVLGLLSLQWGYLSQFLNELTPRLGIGIVIMLAIMIIIGMFVAEEERKYWGWALGAIAFIVVIVLLVESFDATSFDAFAFTMEDVSWLIGAVIFIGLIIAIAVSGGDKKPKDPNSGKATFGKPWNA